MVSNIVSIRKNFDDIVDVMLWQDSSDDPSSSEDDLDEILLEFMFPQQDDANYPALISRIYLMFSARPCLGTYSLLLVFS